jgi:hypothetical protein
MNTGTMGKGFYHRQRKMLRNVKKEKKVKNRVVGEIVHNGYNFLHLLRANVRTVDKALNRKCQQKEMSPERKCQQKKELRYF